MQPLTDRRGLVDLRQAQEHLRLIFGERDWKENEFICVRGIGEKGTEQEGVFREDIFVEPAKEGFAPVLSATERWAQYNVATFVVPGILSDRRATSANVARMRSLRLTQPCVWLISAPPATQRPPSQPVRTG